MAAPASTVGQRIRLVMEKAYAGNQRKMGQLLGVPRAVVSRTVNDQRLPSFEFLEALVRKTAVDAGWLITGEGTPFGEKKVALLADHSLPLAKRFLEKPSAHFGELPRFSFPELEGLYRESRYLAEVQSHDPAVRVKAAKIKEGDLLVLETDPLYWKDDPAQLSCRDCVVSITSGTETTLSLGRVVTEIMPGDVPHEVKVNVYGGGIVEVQLSEIDAGLQKYGKKLRYVGVDGGPMPDVVALNAVVLILWRPS